jgi:uncharacterized membrane protein (UPF0182 family)
MPDTIDWPRPSRRRPRRLLVLIPLVILILSGGTILSYYVDSLWFGSLNFGQIFWKTLALKWGVFAAVSIVAFLVLYGTFLALKRVHRYDLPENREIIVNRQPMTIPVGPLLRWLGLGVSGVVAVISGLRLAAEWPTLARFWYAPSQAGATLDPILGRSLNFYLFSLPFLSLFADLLTTLAFLALGFAVFFLFIASGSRALDAQRDLRTTPSWRGISFTASFLLLVLALQVYLSRFEQIFGEHTVLSGATYIDAHVYLNGMLIVCVALVLGSVIAAVNAFTGGGRRRLASSILPAVLSYVLLQVFGWYVNSFIVKPNELVREQPYISYNIEFTRKAYGLDRVTQREFSAQTTVESADAANNQGTLKNIRLWDWHALQDTLRQIQEIRTYYDFPDIDIDRYEFDGAVHQVMIAARELNIEKLPESSRNWINEKLIYTHGYGVTMNPVNGFTSEGLPTLLLGNMPIQSTVPGLNVTRPEIYFGELTNSDVYVKTGQKEFNYPQGQSNSLTSYEGTGGIVLGGRLRRLLIALDRGDLAKLPFSDDITPDSRLLMRRNVIARASAIAPFLTLDPDPYIVVGNDGRLSWIIDAFTTADTYPYSRHYTFDGGTINYARNSVKIVIDAYNGTTTFYVFDAEDPILASYRAMFPTLFKDAATMPPTLRQHVRYSEQLLKLQAEVYGLYHMTDPEMFYNREDLWTPASESSVDDQGQRSTQPISPNFVLMKLPAENGTEFVNILPFTPSNRNNLIGWIAGRSDGAHYGSAVVYNFPKTRLVDGPLQVEARIDQNAELSGQLTLWNQQGSHVRRGNLLVIPTGNALLYAEPIYLQAERSPMPELRLVVLALQDRLAYGPTFEAAMTSLFGGASSSTTAPQAAQTAAQPAGAPQAQHGDRSSRIAEAAKDLSDYQRLTAEGKLSAAGEKLEQLKRALDDLTSNPQ